MALLAGRAYRAGVEASTWPPTGLPTYTLSAGDPLTVTKQKTGEVIELPFRTRKLSAPVREHIRFSADGAWLFVPVRMNLGAPSYRLSVWDLGHNALVKTIDIDEALLTDRSLSRVGFTGLCLPRSASYDGACEQHHRAERRPPDVHGHEGHQLFSAVGEQADQPAQHRATDAEGQRAGGP